MLNPRDAKGWRVPVAGTLSHQVYRLSRSGDKPEVIAGKIGTTLGSVHVLLWKIRHPEAANRRQYDWLMSGE